MGVVATNSNNTNLVGFEVVTNHLGATIQISHSFRECGLPAMKHPLAHDRT